MIAGQIGLPPGAMLVGIFAHIYIRSIGMKGANDVITKGEKERTE